MEQENKKLKKSVRIKLRKEAEAERKQVLEGRLGAAKAMMKNVPTPPRKMRIVADLVRGRGVFEALNMLRFEPKVGARKMEEVLKTAIANWEQKNQEIDIEDAELYIKEIFIDGGRMLKRLRPAPQGRGHRIRKRSNHITMVIDSRVEEIASIATTTEESAEE